jgi:hypothetical protein
MLNTAICQEMKVNFVARITSVAIITDVVLSAGGYRMTSILYMKMMLLDVRTYESLLILARVSVSVRPRI